MTLTSDDFSCFLIQLPTSLLPHRYVAEDIAPITFNVPNVLCISSPLSDLTTPLVYLPITIAGLGLSTQKTVTFFGDGQSSVSGIQFTSETRPHFRVSYFLRASFRMMRTLVQTRHFFHFPSGLTLIVRNASILVFISANYRAFLDHLA